MEIEVGDIIMLDDGYELKVEAIIQDGSHLIGSNEPVAWTVPFNGAPYKAGWRSLKELS